MSKLKKFFKTPKLFLSDSMWIGYEKIKQSSVEDNLFVISNLGQLSQVESLISSTGIESNFLIVLYTDANTEMPSIIMKKYNKGLFSGVSLLKIPRSPNSLIIKKLLFMERSYKYLIQAIKPKNLYVLSFEGHYAILLAIARNMNIQLSLVEEGTATYKPPMIERKNDCFTKESIKRKLIYYNPILRSIRPSLKWHTEFNHIYAAFPDLLKDTFNSENFHKFFLHSGVPVKNSETYSLVKKYGMTNKDCIYVNQRYPIDNKDFSIAILTILRDISDTFQCKIFIKMHPKDTFSLKQEFKSQIDIMKLKEHIIYIEESAFLIEPTVSLVHPRSVIGLTSTSLIYTPMMSQNTSTYSIAPLFLNMISKRDGRNQKGYKIISSHLDILKIFKNVKYIYSISDLKGLTEHIKGPKNKNKGSGLDHDVFTKH